jgi:hypothetical protein
MIFAFATFSIKIRCRKSSGLIFSPRFIQNINQYLIKKSRTCDFLIDIVPYKKVPDPFEKKAVGRLQHLYLEKKGIFFLKSFSALAMVDTNKQKITLGFKYAVTRSNKRSIFMAFVRLAASLLAVQKGGLPVHSSALCCKGKGYMFSGPSGAGKSTIARNLLLPPWQLFSDDLNIVLPGPRKTFRVYSTPFAQLNTLPNCVNGSANLQSIFFLEKSSRNRMENLAFKKKYVLLLGQTYILPLSNNFGTMILDNAEKICSHVECKRLFCVNNGSIRLYLNHYIRGLQ